MEGRRGGGGDGDGCKGGASSGGGDGASSGGGGGGGSLSMYTTIIEMRMCNDLFGSLLTAVTVTAGSTIPRSMRS